MLKSRELYLFFVLGTQTHVFIGESQIKLLQSWPIFVELSIVQQHSYIVIDLHKRIPKLYL